MIVEDDAKSQRTLQITLEKLGHAVILANDGIQAWEIFCREPLLQVILSDWMMPELDGLMLCERVRLKPQTHYTYFILLTGKTGKENCLKAMDAGVDDFLTKPLDLTDLAICLRTAQRIFDFTSQISRLEEHLQQAQKMESIGQLAGGIAHDFNNIMTVVLGYSSLLLKDDSVSSSIRKKIEAIQSATQKGSQITRHLLAFSRQQFLQPRVIDLNIHLLMLVDLVRRLINEDIELVHRLSNEKMTIKVDPNYLEQVIMNLAVNARDAMPHGGKLILETSYVEIEPHSVRSVPSIELGSYVMLRVKDNGVGMTAEVLERAFEPFFTTKAVGKGSGLGLSTAYGIIKQSGGYIDLQSQPDEGTTVAIYFPRLKVELPEQKNRVEEDQYLPRGSETILVVEDEKDIRNMACDLLIGLGYQVFEACDGQEALELCKQKPDMIQLLFTDVVMPRMNGVELAQQLQVIRPQIKILFASGYADKANLEFGLLDPEVNFLAKPYELSALARKIRDMFDVISLMK